MATKRSETATRFLPEAVYSALFLTSLESTLIQVFILNSLKSFRINTYRKHRGVGGIVRYGPGASLTE